MEMLKKARGKMVILQSSRKFKKKAMWPCSVCGMCHILINKDNCACAWMKLAREDNWSSQLIFKKSEEKSRK